MKGDLRECAPGLSLLDRRIARLCTHALAGQWSVERDVPWAALDLQSVAPPIRAAMSRIYTDVLMAESLGLELAARIHDLAPEGELRRFTGIQVVEEARHVAFFARVVDKLGSAERTSESIALLGRELRSITDYDALVLHGQVIERAAHTLFVENAKRSRSLMARAVRIRGSAAAALLIDSVVELIGRDESRHIAAGSLYLLHLARATPREAWRSMARSAAVSCGLVQRIFASAAPDYARLGFASAELLDLLWDAQRRHFGRMNLDIGEAPV